MFHNLKRQLKTDSYHFWGFCSKVRPRTSLGEAPAHTAAVAVDTFRASARLRCRTREFVMVSKWDSGTHPRCRSESLVPSTQSEEEKKRCKWRHVSVVKQHASGKWLSYGQCFVDALKQCQLFPVTVHQAVGRQMLGYTASVENLCVGREQRISIRAFKTNSRPKKI